MRVRLGSPIVLAMASAFALLGQALLAAPAPAVTIDWVFVGDPGNAPDAVQNCEGPGCGSVGYGYFIAEHEVTNTQYAEFLNAKAATDPLGLYNPNMASSALGGITRSGTIGSYTYAVKPGFANKPVNFVSFFDALRFTNWLGNGQGSGDTEDGAYPLLGGTATPSNGATVTSNGGNIFLPSENEWYKAAYYDPSTATYFDFPAGTDSETSCAAPMDTPNRANCDDAAGGVSDVGAYEGSASPNGTFDQGGNVQEWNEQITSGSGRVVRGGSWIEGADILASSTWINAAPTVETSTFGFRLASLVPEPGASLLAATAFASLVALRKRAGGTVIHRSRPGAGSRRRRDRRHADPDLPSAGAG